MKEMEEIVEWVLSLLISFTPVHFAFIFFSFFASQNRFRSLFFLIFLPVFL